MTFGISITWGILCPCVFTTFEAWVRLSCECIYVCFCVGKVLINLKLSDVLNLACWFILVLFQQQAMHFLFKSATKSTYLILFLLYVVSDRKAIRVFSSCLRKSCEALQVLSYITDALSFVDIHPLGRSKQS